MQPTPHANICTSVLLIAISNDNNNNNNTLHLPLQVLLPLLLTTSTSTTTTSTSTTTTTTTFDLVSFHKTTTDATVICPLRIGDRGEVAPPVQEECWTQASFTNTHTLTLLTLSVVLTLLCAYDAGFICVRMSLRPSMLEEWQASQTPLLHTLRCWVGRMVDISHFAQCKELQQIPGNDKCAHCDASNPTWASVTLGILLCMKCSGLHRSYGVQISFVRSLTLDTLTPNQLNTLRNGGNEAFLNDCPDRDCFSIEAELYRRKLHSKVTGEPLREISDMDREELQNMKNQFVASQSQFISIAEPPEWVPDKTSPVCQHCNASFTMINRSSTNALRLLTLTCDEITACAPASNTKPIPAFRISTPVRHCLRCLPNNRKNSNS
eukprot:gene10449-2580_t